MKKILNQLFDQDLMMSALGICPLLVVTTTLITGVTMGVICLLTLTIIAIAVSGLRNLVPCELRIVMILLISTTVVTVIHLAMRTWFYELSLTLGIYIPLLAMNCLLLAHAEEYALCHGVIQSLLHSLKTGSSMVFLLTVAGMIREVIGSGSMLQQSELLFGETARSWTVSFVNVDPGFPVFTSAPGAFLVLGLVLALHNFMKTRAQRLPSR